MKNTIGILFLLFAVTTFASASSINKGFTGTWDYHVSTTQGDYKGEIVIEKVGDTYSGYMVGEGGKIELQNVKVEENTLTFKINVDGYACYASINKEGNEFKGNVSVEGESFPMSGKKK